MAQLIECSEPGCGRIKREANRWFVVYNAHDDIRIYTWENGREIAARSMEVADALSDSPNALIVCGEACALKAVSRLMGEMK